MGYLIPWEKDNPLRNTPVMVYILVGVNVLVFIFIQSVPSGEVLLHTGALNPQSPSWLNLFTALCIPHSVMGLLVAGHFLWMFGDNIKDVLGPFRFLAFFLACGLVAQFVELSLSSESSQLITGSSGAVSGVVGAYLVFFRYAHVDVQLTHTEWEFSEFYTSALGAVFSWFLFQTIFALVARHFTDAEVIQPGFVANLSGFVAGVLIALLLKRHGIRAKRPPRRLVFMRHRKDRVWCPHCGHDEEEHYYWEYNCKVCGTKYEISNSGPD